MDYFIEWEEPIRGYSSIFTRTTDLKNVEVCNIHHEFLNNTQIVEESIMKIYNYSNADFLIVCGDFNITISDIENKFNYPQITSVAPSLFNYKVEEIFLGYRQINKISHTTEAVKSNIQFQSAWSIDGGFYMFPNKDSRIFQASRIIINPQLFIESRFNLLKILDQMNSYQKAEMAFFRPTISIDYRLKKCLHTGKILETQLKKLAQDIKRISGYKLNYYEYDKISVTLASNLLNEQKLMLFIPKQFHDELVENNLSDSFKKYPELEIYPLISLNNYCQFYYFVGSEKLIIEYVYSMCLHKLKKKIRKRTHLQSLVIKIHITQTQMFNPRFLLIIEGSITGHLIGKFDHVKYLENFLKFKCLNFTIHHIDLNKQTINLIFEPNHCDYLLLDLYSLTKKIL
jgi:hypothetical protein